MIDPTKYMPVLQCYKCYNVTTRGDGMFRPTPQIQIVILSEAKDLGCIHVSAALCSRDPSSLRSSG